MYILTSPFSCVFCLPCFSVRFSLPFILVGALDDWDYPGRWSPSVLGSLYPDATVDFYPHNMDQLTVRPYLTPLSKALHEQLHPTHAYPESETHPGSYIQWNVNWHDWQGMTRNMGKAGLPKVFAEDDSFLVETPKECFATHELQDEFTRRTHWRMVLIGIRVRDNNTPHHTPQEENANRRAMFSHAFLSSFCVLGRRHVQSSGCSSYGLLSGPTRRLKALAPVCAIRVEVDRSGRRCRCIRSGL